jgi:hypothetical protein
MLRYYGPRREHLPNNYVEEYGPDTAESKQSYLKTRHDETAPQSFRLDGDWGYQFNSLGYRCQEYDPDADLKVFASGCSNTLGVGIRLEQTWPYLVTKSYQGCLSKPCLMNFSQGSASNDYIARTAITQCAAATPDLLLVNFTSMARKEHVDRDGKIRNLLPAEKPDAVSRAFYKNHTVYEGLINALKNILQVQFFCKARGIDFIFAWGDHRMLSSSFTQDLICGPLIELVDRDRFCDFGLKDGDVFIDLARDLMHPGPRSHNIFASRMLERLAKLRYRSYRIGQLPEANNDIPRI